MRRRHPDLRRPTQPRYPDVYTNLATAYAQSGDSEQAVKTLEMALVLDPSLAEAHNNMGCLLKAHGRMQDAKASFEAAVKQRPGFAVAWNNLGGIHKAMGAYDDALRCYEQAVHLAPAFADAHCNLATLYHDLGQVKVGSRALPRPVVAHSPTSQPVPQDAMASYQKAVSLRPGFAIALSNLGNCYAEVRHSAGAFPPSQPRSPQPFPSFPGRGPEEGAVLLPAGRAGGARVPGRAGQHGQRAAAPAPRGRGHRRLSRGTSAQARPPARVLQPGQRASGQGARTRGCALLHHRVQVRSPQPAPHARAPYAPSRTPQG